MHVELLSIIYLQPESVRARDAFLFLKRSCLDLRQWGVHPAFWELRLRSRVLRIYFCSNGKGAGDSRTLNRESKQREKFPVPFFSRKQSMHSGKVFLIRRNNTFFVQYKIPREQNYVKISTYIIPPLPSFVSCTTVFMT